MIRVVLQRVTGKVNMDPEASTWRVCLSTILIIAVYGSVCLIYSIALSGLN